nr:MAG TPA: hypothetical protein [Caudoviricetes sp.]
MEFDSVSIFLTFCCERRVPQDILLLFLQSY